MYVILRTGASIFLPKSLVSLPKSFERSLNLNLLHVHGLRIFILFPCRIRRFDRLFGSEKQDDFQIISSKSRNYDYLKLLFHRTTLIQNCGSKNCDQIIRRN